VFQAVPEKKRAYSALMSRRSFQIPRSWLLTMCGLRLRQHS